jgi:hypothetical protein
VLFALPLGMLVAGLVSGPAMAAAGDPSPSPSDIVSPSASPTDTPSPSATPSPPPSPSATPSPSPVGRPTPPPPPSTGPPSGTPGTGRRHHRRHRHGRHWIGWSPSTSWGAYSTALLDAAADRLRAAGVPSAAIDRRIYRPFILEGPATWSDSWHAPRYGGGFHLHEGQDVLCRYGAPVLAAEPGALRFSSDPLGGLSAYVDLAGGGWLYYAHLSRQFTSLAGTRVVPGEPIGLCGASGDATVPHVHFALYDASGVARDPMALLVRWLHAAERRVADTTSRAREDAALPGAMSLEGGLAHQALIPTSAVTVEPSEGPLPAPSNEPPGPWRMALALAVVPLAAGAMRSSKLRDGLLARLRAGRSAPPARPR